MYFDLNLLLKLMFYLILEDVGSEKSSKGYIVLFFIYLVFFYLYYV